MGFLPPPDDDSTLFSGTVNWTGSPRILEATDNTVAFQISGGDATGTNVAGGDLQLEGGQSTGNGTPGNVIIQCAPAGGSGSVLNTLQTIATFSAGTTAMTILPAASGDVGLLIKGAASQAADVLQFQASNGDKKATLNYAESGHLVQYSGDTAGPTLTLGTGLSVPAGDLTDAWIVLNPGNGTSGRAGVCWIDDRVSFSTIAGQPMTILSYWAIRIIGGAQGASPLVTFANNDATYGTFIENHTTGAVALNVRGASGQTADLFRVESASPTTLVKVNSVGVFFPVQAATASAPTYVKGGMYFDTTLNKLRIGGATAWETVTSS